MDTITLLPLLSQSLSAHPQTRREAERILTANEVLPGFLLSVLSCVQGAGEAPMECRLAAGVLFKNVVKRRWAEEATPLVPPTEDRVTLKSQLVGIMISLSSTPSLQSQIGEAIAAIAEVDFPEEWMELIDQLTSLLSPTDFQVNIGVLSTAHSIFKRWKSQFRTDALYSEINYVIERFGAPFLEIFKQTDLLLSQPPSPTTPPMAHLTQTLLLCLQLFHDLSSQDLPPFIEDNMTLFFGSGAPDNLGLLGKYLRSTFGEPEGVDDDEDDTPGPVQKIRAQICEILALFTMKYGDALSTPLLAPFIQGVWEFLGKVGSGTKSDVLVSKSLGFLGTVVKMGDRRGVFEGPGVLRGMMEGVVVGNMVMRTHEEEMFEDDPIEYIRTDLEPSTESDTRRQSATEFTRALMEQFEGEVTEIVKGYIDVYLQQYAANPAANWKQKDTAIYLLTSIASRGSTATLGVTSTNVLVDVIKFFGENVFSDLQAPEGSVHIILTVDAIKFLWTFRNQLTKEQLLSVFPLLIRHLSSDNYVVYSYAAITIERILFIKQNGHALFSQADIRPFAQDILLALFKKIESGSTPEKIAENDYLMRCVMRVIITARQTLIPVYLEILQHLVAIISEISKNPSNPKFNQYAFEALSALVRFVAQGNESTLPQFEGALFGPIMNILSTDVAEFVPYAFQVLSQLLELHPSTSLPENYQSLLGPLLTATLWESRGNVPALVRLWKALLKRGAPLIVANNQLESLLGVFQKLISSNFNDVHGFSLLQGMFESVPIASLRPYIRTILVLLSTRLQSSKTPNFLHCFVYFFCFVFAIQVEGLSPDVMIAQFETVQTGIFGGILQGVILPEVQKTSVKNRKVVTVGLARLLTHSQSMLSEPLLKFWPATMNALLKIFVLPQDLSNTTANEDDIAGLDVEDGSYQAGFSKLGASETIVEDPAAYVADAKTYLTTELDKVAIPPTVIAQVDNALLAPFISQKK